MSIDEAILAVKNQDLERGMNKPYLDAEVKKVQQIDNQIRWFKKKLEDLEYEKQQQLRKTMELFDTTMVSSHSLKNGYTVLVDDRYAINILDTGEFLKWLKVNCQTSEVLEFFSNSLKVASLKKFCSKKINEMRANGALGDEVAIGGIEILEKDFRRLTTKTIEPKVKK